MYQNQFERSSQQQSDSSSLPKKRSANVTIKYQPIVKSIKMEEPMDEIATYPTEMSANLQERFEIFTPFWVNEFELFTTIQLLIIQDKTNENDESKGIVLNTLNELLNTDGGLPGKTLGGIKDYIMQERKLDLAGKIVKLVNKYENAEEAKAVRRMLVRVAHELVRCFEFQIRRVEKIDQGWPLALARAAVWCFMNGYKYSQKEELDEESILEAITLKNAPNMRFWQEWCYQDDKKIPKEQTNEKRLLFHAVKLFSQSGVVLNENQTLIYYKNNVTKPEKYGFRHNFSHESNEKIKSEFTEVEPPRQMNYNYALDMETDDKVDMCEKMLKELNLNGGNPSKEHLMENRKRIVKSVIENLWCEMMEQMVAAVKQSRVTGTSSEVVNNKSTVNENFVCDTQNADIIVTEIGAEYQGPVVISF